MSNYAIDANYPTRLGGNDYQWINGKLVDTNNMQDPYVVNSLLSRQTQTGPTEGLAATDYVTSAGSNNYSPYLKFSNDSTVQGPTAKTALEQQYDFSGLTSGDGLASQSWGDRFKSWFTPDGKSGQSVGGNVIGAVGTGVQALSGLAGMYYADKNYKLQKDQADYLKSRDAASDTRMSKFASNAGNGASY